MAQRYPRFIRAISALGKTRKARALALPAHELTIDRLLVRLPESIELFHAHPHILRALADDLEAILEDE